MKTNHITAEELKSWRKKGYELRPIVQWGEHEYVQTSWLTGEPDYR